MSKLRAGAAQALPAEGADGLFSESWFPVCLSSDVKKGQVIGRDFLDGRIVIFRGEDGQPHVVSGYCPHLGTELSCADVVGNRLRCAYHHWEFNGDGSCAKTGIGDPVPPTARLFRFAVRERWGIIFAFNGREATWELPSFRYPDEELYLTVESFPEIACDPWTICCNTPDVQHIRVVHNIRLDEEGATKGAYTGHSMKYGLKGWHANGVPIDWQVSIHGTSLFFQEGEFNGHWCAVSAPLGLPRPGRTVVYVVIATRPENDSPEALARAKEISEAFRKVEINVLFEDMPILQRIHFRAGTLTKSDARLAQFFEYLRGFPRSHHSAEHIR